MSNSSSSQPFHPTPTPTPTRIRPQTAGPRSFSNRAPIISNGNNNTTTTTTNNNNNNGKKREETPASVHDNIQPAPLPLYRYDSR